MTLQETFTAWMEADRLSKEWAERERSLRTQLADGYFPDSDPEGTGTLPLNDGWELKCTRSVRRKLLNTKGETLAVVQQLPPEVAEEVVSWKPDLKLRGYRKLQDEHRELLDTVVESKPSLPSLKLVPPKEEK